MPAKPIQISIDVELLERIDADPETRSRGRSAFVRSAIQRYLAAKGRRQLDLQIASAYKGRADAALDDAVDLMEAQEWPDD
jgi:metal-responsive CopG/Arc/MetJ family transcriptional regulator